MEKTNKVKTFIGFAMRTGKFRIGTNAAATLKKASLVIVCHTAAENTKKEADKLAKKFHAPVLETVTTTLSELTHRENAKIMAIADKNLSQAILENSNNDFIRRNLGDLNNG